MGSDFNICLRCHLKNVYLVAGFLLPFETDVDPHAGFVLGRMFN